MLQTAAGEIALVDEHDVTTPRDPAITIIHAVDRRVVLIMTSDRGERERLPIRHARILIKSGIDDKIGLLGRCQPLTLRSSNIQPKTTWLFDAIIEVYECREDRLNRITNLSVVGDKLGTSDPRVRQCGQRHPRDDFWF